MDVERLWSKCKESRTIGEDIRGYKYMVETGKTIPNLNKQKKRKRCRYNKRATFSLVHGDWHRTTEAPPHAIVRLDDASRFVLAGKEYEHATVENTIESFKSAIICADEYNGQIREVKYDRDRWRFGSIDEFIQWHNQRMHGALWVDIGECPQNAVFQKSNPANLLGLFARWFND